jgi:hypothetical protein
VISYAGIDHLMQQLDQYQERLRYLQMVLAERHRVYTEKRRFKPLLLLVYSSSAS